MASKATRTRRQPVDDVDDPIEDTLQSDSEIDDENNSGSEVHDNGSCAEEGSHPDQAEVNNSNRNSDPEEEEDDDDDEVVFSDASSQVEVIKAYRELTCDAEKLVNAGDSQEDYKGSNVRLGKNIRRGLHLSNLLEVDASTAATALQHALAVVRAASVNVNNCGRTDTNYFSIRKYMDAIKRISRDEDGLYENQRAHQIFSNSRLNHSNSVENPMISLLGAVTIQESENSNTPDTANKTARRRTIVRPEFESMSLTQHEVVNLKAKNKKGDTESDAIRESARKAEKLKKLCADQNKATLSLVEYGFKGQANSAKDFLRNVFEAAVITRDGFAEVTFPEDKEKKNARNYVKITNSGTGIQAARPPRTNATTSDTFDLNRFQQIVSFNASTIKMLLGHTGSN